MITIRRPGTLVPAPDRWYLAITALLVGVAIGIGAGAPLLIILLDQITVLAERPDGWVAHITALLSFSHSPN